MKRIVFFSCRCTSTSCDSSYDDDGIDDEALGSNAFDGAADHDMVSAWTFHFSDDTKTPTSKTPATVG